MVGVNKFRSSYGLRNHSAEVVSEKISMSDILVLNYKDTATFSEQLFAPK